MLLPTRAHCNCFEGCETALRAAAHTIEPRDRLITKRRLNMSVNITTRGQHVKYAIIFNTITRVPTCSLSGALGVVGATSSSMLRYLSRAIPSRAMLRARSRMTRPAGAGPACLHTWPTMEDMANRWTAATASYKPVDTCMRSRRSQAWTSTSRTGRPRRFCGTIRTASGHKAWRVDV